MQADLRRCLSWNSGLLMSPLGLVPRSTQNDERERVDLGAGRWVHMLGVCYSLLQHFF